MEWRRISPVYPVADVAAVTEWYNRVLGFEPRLVNPPGDNSPVYAIVHRDGVSAHLMRVDEAPYGLTSQVQAQFWISSDLTSYFVTSKRMELRFFSRP